MRDPRSLLQPLLDLHERVAKAVARGEPDVAEAAMTELLAEVRDAMLPLWRR